MTSSLQRQEVRIPTILSPSSSTLSSTPSSGCFLPHPTGSRPPPSLYPADPHLSGGCPSWSSLRFPGWEGRELCFLFDYRKTASERESDLPKVTQLEGRALAGMAQIILTFSRAQRLYFTVLGSET